jgi:hypothetical protein
MARPGGIGHLARTGGLPPPGHRRRHMRKILASVLVLGLSATGASAQKTYHIAEMVDVIVAQNIAMLRSGNDEVLRLKQQYLLGFTVELYQHCGFFTDEGANRIGRMLRMETKGRGAEDAKLMIGLGAEDATRFASRYACTSGAAGMARQTIDAFWRPLMEVPGPVLEFLEKKAGEAAGSGARERRAREPVREPAPGEVYRGRNPFED